MFMEHVHVLSNEAKYRYYCLRELRDPDSCLTGNPTIKSLMR